MNRPDRRRTRIAAALTGACCAATLAACPLMSSGEKAPGNPNMTFDSAQSLCTDGTHLYLTEGVAAPLGTVKSVTLATHSSSTAVATGLDHPTCILTDGQHLFWLEDDSGPNGAVRRSKMDGSEPVAMASALDHPHAIAINGTYVFFADKRGGVAAITRVPKGGGEATTLATLSGDFNTTLVADESWVYFTAPYDLPGGTIGRVPVAGGSPETVITGLGTPTALALSGNTLCFTEFMGGRVGCVQDVTASWTPVPMTSGENVNFGTCPGLLLLDSGTVYFAISASATSDAIRMVIPGYAPVTVATTESFGQIMGMAILGAKIYWLQDDSLWSVKKGY